VVAKTNQDDVEELVLRVLTDGPNKYAKVRSKAYQLLLNFYKDREKASEELEVLEAVAQMGFAITTMVEEREGGE